MYTEEKRKKNVVNRRNVVAAKRIKEKKTKQNEHKHTNCINDGIEVNGVRKENI